MIGCCTVHTADAFHTGIAIKTIFFLFLQVLLKTQSTALGRPLDTERLAAMSASLKMLKEIRNTENSRYGTDSRGLWLQQGGSGVRGSASRQIIGFVTAAQFAYHAGGYIGVGYVALAGLRQLSPPDTVAPPLLTDQRPLVLVRETTSLQYRFARLEVVPL